MTLHLVQVLCEALGAWSCTVPSKEKRILTLEEQRVQLGSREALTQLVQQLVLSGCREVSVERS